MKKLNISIIFFIFILISCTPFFISHDFDIQTAYHQNIAILPFEMNYTGIIPDDLDETTMGEIEIAESKAFMTSYYNEILRSTKNGKKPIRVNVQHYKDTFRTLSNNNISIVDSWNMKDQDLASLLQVDAVLRGHITKNQLITDLESFGIEFGLHILNAITKDALWPWVPYNLSKSKEINANYTLINGEDGSTLWSIAYEVEADWRQPADQIIDNVNRRSSKKFPYRIN